MGGGYIDGYYDLDGSLCVSYNINSNTASFRNVHSFDAYTYNVYASTLYPSYGGTFNVIVEYLHGYKIRNWTLNTYSYSTSFSIAYSSYTPKDDFVKVNTTGKFLYNDKEVLTQGSVHSLPDNYFKGEDDLLYVERHIDNIVPVSHPDYSTQPSILPQRFGTQNVYEMLVPIKRQKLEEMPYLNNDNIIKCLYYLKEFFNDDHKVYYDRCIYMSTSGNKDFEIFEDDLEIYYESLGNCFILVCQNYIQIIDPNCNIIIDFDYEITDDVNIKDRLYNSTCIDKSFYCLIPAKIHTYHTSENIHKYFDFLTISGDVYICDSEISDETINKNATAIYNYLCKKIKDKQPDYNLNNIPDFDFFDTLDSVANSTIIDAKLISSNGAISPCQVFSKFNIIIEKPTICIKEVLPTSINYDWCMIQYVGTLPYGSYGYYGDC